MLSCQPMRRVPHGGDEDALVRMQQCNTRASVGDKIYFGSVSMHTGKERNGILIASPADGGKAKKRSSQTKHGAKLR